MDKNSTVTLHTGRTMPIIGIGTWNLKSNTAEAIVHAITVGYKMIDTSGDYGTQPGIAEGIKQSGVSRDGLYIVTKVEETDDAYQATKGNLSELELEHADLMLIHRPPDTGVGEELWNGLIRAKEEGLTTDIGVSNYSEPQIQALIDKTGEVPVVNQIEWSPFGWSMSMKRFCQEHGIIIQAYSPLTHDTRLDDDRLQDMAVKYERTPAQILIRWALQHGTVPLPKANNTDHQVENLEVFDFEINSDDMRVLDELNENYSALGNKLVYAKQR